MKTYRIIAYIASISFLMGGRTSGFTMSSFGRVMPRTSEKDLREIPGFEQGGEFQCIFPSSSDLPQREKDELTRSFLRGTDVRWLIVGGDGTKRGASESEEVEIRYMHWKATSYLMEVCLRFAADYGEILVCRDEKDGQYLGSICLLPPYGNEMKLLAHLIITFLKLGVPVPLKMDGGARERFLAMAGSVLLAHDEVLEDKPHWYVVNLGVAESAQGMGVGRKLLDAAATFVKSKSAQKEGGGTETLPIYLECHDGNVGFYEKMGYHKISRFDITPRLKSNVGDSTPYPINGMMRHAS